MKMLSIFMEQLRHAADKIEKEIARLHELNKQLTDNLHFLFEEEEIKECKNYELFKLIYDNCHPEEPQTTSRTKAKSKIGGQHIELPSIYAPKGSRTKIALASAAPTPEFEAERKSVHGPNECLVLDEGASAGEIIVDQIEIQGKIYLFADGKFYDLSGAFVGQIQANIIVIKDEPFSLNEKVLTHVSDQYFTDGQGGAYTKCNEHIARMIGEIRDDNIYEFS